MYLNDQLIIYHLIHNLLDLSQFTDIISNRHVVLMCLCVKVCDNLMKLNSLTYLTAIVCAYLIALTASVSAQEFNNTQNASGSVVSTSENLPIQAKILINAYPEQHLNYSDNQIIFDDGTSIEFDDAIEKDFSAMMDDSDVEDMFSMKYNREGTPAYLQDPGRSRCEPLFKKMYGKDSKSVRKNLVKVDWFGSTIKFTQINGAAEHLKKVAEEIRHDHPELIPYMKSAGTFNWRKVRHANRQSAHSYGIAIDIAVKQSDYWKWSNPKASETDKIEYHNRIPMALVEVFEKHGFIWGGRWYHYDTMHFEYRPEIIQMQQPE